MKRLFLFFSIISISVFSFAQEVKYSSELQVLAESGDALAQYRLGRCYYLDDMGINPDIDEAVKWLTKASDQGLPEAQYELGSLYLLGKGVEQDESEGKRLMVLSAEVGYTPAQYLMGLICLYDDESENRSSASFKWFSAAAGSGHPYSMRYLALFYLTGDAVDQNYQMTLEWYRKACLGELPKEYKVLFEEESEILSKAISGEAAAQYDLARSIDYLPNVFENKKKEASKWYGESFRRNYPPAVLYVALRDRDYQALLTAAESGNLGAELLIATIWLRGKDYAYYDDEVAEEIHQLMGKYYKSNATFAISDLGSLENCPEKVDLDQALLWYSKVALQYGGIAKERSEWIRMAKKGDGEALYRLGKSGGYVPTWTYIEEAAQNGYGPAMIDLGKRAYGEKAESWYKKAVDAGSTEAYYYLGAWYEGNEDYDNAIKYLTASLPYVADTDNESYCWFLLGNCYYHKGFFDNALIWLRKAYEEGKMNLAEEITLCYLEKKDYKRALEWVDKITLQGETEEARAAYLRGQCYQGLGREREAAECFRKATELYKIISDEY